MNTVEVTSWKQGISWKTTLLSHTTEYDYFEDCGIGIRYLMQQRNSSQWVKTVPVQYLSAILSFEKKYKEYSLACLWFSSRSQYARELLINSPFLMWLILRHAVTNQLDSLKVFELFSLKRKDILALDGLPAEPRLVKFFERLDESGVVTKQYERIKRIINENGSRELCCFRVINDQNLRLIEASPRLLKYPFFRNMTEKDDCKNLLMLLGETKVLGQNVEPINVEGRLERCKTLVELKRLRNDYVKRDRDFFESYAASELLPPPPIKGSKHIQHIRFKRDLIQEGVDMNHCIASYFSDVLNGKYFVYRILAPERATAGFRYRGGKLVHDQTRVINNGIPSNEVMSVIKNWLYSK